MQLFLEESRPEINTVGALNSLLGFAVDSLQCETAGSVGFVQISNYTQGFPQGLLITWPGEIALSSTPLSLVTALAKKLSTNILVEQYEGEDDWILISPGGFVENVAVEILDDGITIEKKLS